MKREQYANKMLCISVTFQHILIIMQKLTLSLEGIFHSYKAYRNKMSQPCTILCNINKYFVFVRHWIIPLLEGNIRYMKRIWGVFIYIAGEEQNTREGEEREGCSPATI